MGAKHFLKVAYLNESTCKAKYVERWSSQIRLANEIDARFLQCQQNAVYKQGVGVKVYSTTQAKWIDGVIDYSLGTLVNVRYGKSEKLLPINSHEFRLI